jgi:hypothetical protein
MSIRQRIYEKLMKLREYAERVWREENPNWDEQVKDATPAGSDGPPGDPDTIKIGPK